MGYRLRFPAPICTLSAVYLVGCCICSRRFGRLSCLWRCSPCRGWLRRGMIQVWNLAWARPCETWKQTRKDWYTRKTAFVHCASHVYHHSCGLHLFSKLLVLLQGTPSSLCVCKGNVQREDMRSRRAVPDACAAGWCRWVVPLVVLLALKDSEKGK
jgi:hypothetical protein